MAVLVVLLLATGLSSSFVWFFQRQQTRAGIRYRSAVALAAAEAGVHRALGVLESVAPDGWSPGHLWRPHAHAEAYRIGALEARSVVSISEEADGALLVTGTGEAGGVTRRLRARVHLASPALLTGLYAASLVRLEERPAATVVLPYGRGIGDRPWIHIAAGQGVWFATGNVSINDPSVRLSVGPGPMDPPGEPPDAPRAGPVRLLLARRAELTLGWDRQRVELPFLRAAGIHVEGVVFRGEALPGLPEVDRAHYRARAGANRLNAPVHRAAGEFLGDVALADKPDSVYTPDELRRLLTYFRDARAVPRLAGVIYLQGGIELVGGQRLEITDGTLVAESTVHLIEGASLEILHSPATRTWPGLVVLDDGALLLAQGARLRVHGLVYVSRLLDAGDGVTVDVVGAVLAGDTRHSVRNRAATVVIRYDPAVMGTPGLRLPPGTQPVVWVASWEELP
ncbi:MAG: hypothetical protein QN183_11775 [Armatimonadota bacterium]|nr:hypothetical protein [Armatimonadota bacterium]MDR7485084.1 hypothetical protein [Armatimonadota bacterium]MDR7537027.1 hypothetical protein [Armatimonadota bacterium]